MNKSKSLFLMITLYGTILTISSNNWISMWMGLEMNMMGFIPLMSNKNKSTSEAMMIYLLTQSISSMILMFAIIMMNLTMNSTFHIMILISILIKLGAAPFHMWLPEILTKMTWSSNMMLLTWQKMAPMMMLNNLIINNKIIYMSTALSVTVGALGGLNQMSLRKIMGYSSINHLGWMLSLSKTKNNWMIYLLIYSMMVISLCWMFQQYNVVHINQINNLNMTMTEKLNYIIMMLSMGGLPPFLGFLPKWMVIQTMINNNMIMLLMLMIMCSLISLFYYMRTMTSMMLSFSTMNKWIKIKINNNLINLMMMMNFSLPVILILNMF
uniref:NADH-ubiquinone oxidoreductase chain 2 n=1 Tax=Scutiphora pedicellata TaxID=2080403 RepID=A0A2K9YV33_9HEMI|nr:NADH dehydrogenase subunit 2 [Scutiphora pedicellata]